MKSYAMLVSWLLMAAAPGAAEPIPTVPPKQPITDLPVLQDSMLIAQLQSLEVLRTNLEELMKGISADEAKVFADDIEKSVVKLLADRNLAGIDADRRIYLSIHDLSQLTTGDAPICLALPAKDYKNFRNQFLTAGERKSFFTRCDGIDEIELSETFVTQYLVHTQGYVITTANEDLAKEYAKEFLPMSVKDLPEKGEPFLDADAAVFLNFRQINKAFGPQIQQFKSLIPFLMQQGAEGVSPQQLVIVEKLLGAAFQAFEDGHGLTLAAQVEKAGIRVRGYAHMNDGTIAARALRGNPSQAQTRLNKLPTDFMIYSSSEWSAQANELLRMNPEFVAEPNDEKLQNAIDKYQALLTQTQPVSAWNLGTTSLSMIQAEKPEDLVVAFGKVIKNLETGSLYTNIKLKNSAVFKADFAKHQGIRWNRATLYMDFEASAKDVIEDTTKEATIASMKMLLPETVNLYFGADETTFYVIQAKDWDEAKAIIDRQSDEKKLLNSQEEFQKLRAKLPNEVNWLGIIDLGPIWEWGMNFAKSLTPFGEPPYDLPKLKIPSKNWLGLSVLTRSNAVQLDMFVPVTVIKTIREELVK